MGIEDKFKEFKERYILYKKQEFALEKGFSYFDVTTSNMDGTFFGEEFDNPIRIKALKAEYPEFCTDENIEAFDKEAREEFEKDLNEAEK